MAKPQLSIHSAKARNLAYRLARRENCSIADIVERAPEAYEICETSREPAARFYARMAAPSDAEDIDLEANIKEGRKKHPGIDL
jgi:hypothetical protein